MLAALRCPECTAPARDLAKCAYCGATLAFAAPAVDGAARTEDHYALVLRVGPSNVERVAQLLTEHLGIEPAEARARLARPPTEFPLGREEIRAREIASQAKAAGAQADVTSRAVAVPLFTVTLENAGPKPLAVVVALRSEIELTVPEAKDLVAAVPSVVAVRVEEAQARSLVAALERAGATVSRYPH